MRTSITSWIATSSHYDRTTEFGPDYYYWVTASADSSGNSESEFSSFAVGQEGVPLLISIADVELAEGDTGTVNYEFAVSLSATHSIGVLVDYSTNDDTATAGSDYSSASGTLMIEAGQLTGIINIEVNGDTSVENDETFFVNISNARGGAITDGEGVGTILNDGAVSVSADFDSDGDVDGFDFLAWQRGYGIQTPNATKSDGDANTDGDVDGEDLVIWEDQFGTGSASLVAAISTEIEPATTSLLDSETTGPPAEPLSAELVDAAIAMELSIQSKPRYRFRSQSPLSEDHFDWMSRMSKWAQHPDWQGTSAISNHISHGRASQIYARRVHRDTDSDGVNEELLDELFADGELNILL